MGLLILNVPSEISIQFSLLPAKESTFSVQAWKWNDRQVTSRLGGLAWLATRFDPLKAT